MCAPVIYNLSRQPEKLFLLALTIMKGELAEVSASSLKSTWDAD